MLTMRVYPCNSWPPYLLCNSELFIHSFDFNHSNNHLTYAKAIFRNG